MVSFSPKTLNKVKSSESNLLAQGLETPLGIISREFLPDVVTLFRGSSSKLNRKLRNPAPKSYYHFEIINPNQIQTRQLNNKISNNYYIKLNFFPTYA